MHDMKTAIGLMSGTSMDGIDGALIKTDGHNRLEIMAHFSIEYDDIMRERLKAALALCPKITAPNARFGGLSQLEDDLTLRHSALVNKFLHEHNYRASDIDIIGFHGQTICHKPQQGFSVQIGNGPLLAKTTNIDVIYNMRANDMAHGGQGAPLSPVYHQALIAKYSQVLAPRVAFINIGGISNLTYIDNGEIISAFDCGPGNALIDQWMMEKANKLYDKDGETASQGMVDQDIVSAYLSQPFFKSAKAYSLDWQEFAPLKGAISLSDGAATLAFLTAKSIVHSLRHLKSKPQVLLLSGGGIYNKAIMAFLKQLSGEAGINQVKTTEEIGLDSKFIEAEAWGYLAVRALYGQALTFPQTTQCSEAVSGGVLARHISGAC